MKKAVITKYVLFAMLAVLLLGVTACGKRETGKKYEIYFMNSGSNKLVKKDYRSNETNSQILVDNLIAQMNVRQKESDYVVIKPDNVTVSQSDFSEGVVTLTFNDAYYDMKSATEVLLRAAIVQELCQIEGVDYVKFMVADQEAVLEDGTVIGLMNLESFANDSDENIGNIEWKTINLYYASKAGDKLIKDEVTVAYSKNISLEKMVVEKLIKGPVHTGTYATLPSDMRLLSISVNNGTCYVNLSSEFSTEMVNVLATIPVYSIVNSLCDLDTVENVKILINGNSTKTFRESINLDTIFNYNDSLL